MLLKKMLFIDSKIRRMFRHLMEVFFRGQSAINDIENCVNVATLQDFILRNGIDFAIDIL